jgi:two-component system, OmpR family, alkaline phosphatase synthesis response regulator PhoP
MALQQKILLVDDEPDILEFLSYNFRKKEFNVITANNGLEGITKAQTEMPDIIVSDIMMPTMNGIELCKYIRNNSGTNLTPFIFLTALNDDYKVLHAMLSGADEFVTKPIRFEYLLAIVNRVMAEKEN